MNNEHNDKTFKIFGDEPSPGHPEEEELLLDSDMIASEPGRLHKKAKPAKKTSRGFWGTALFFVLFFICLGLGGALYLTYLHMDERLNHIEASGSHEVADLSRELDERMGVFSTQFAGQHAEMHLQIEALRKLVESNAASAQSMKTAIDSNKQAISQGLARLETGMTRLSDRLGKIDSETGGKIAAFEKQLAALAGVVETADKTGRDLASVRQEMVSVRQEMEAMQARYAAVSARLDSLENEREDTELQKQINELKKAFDQQLETMQNRMERKTISLEDDISALEAMMQSFKDLTLPDSDRTVIIEQELR